MLMIKSHQLKSAALPENIGVNLDPVEENVFALLKEASDSHPQNPIPRVVGGWVRDKLLGKPSKDIDVSIDIMGGSEFGQFLFQYATQKWGNRQRVVTETKSTEARPEQIKNLSVSFLTIYGQDVEILPLRAVEYYEPGNRNPKAVYYPELVEFSRKPGGIPAFLKQVKPELYTKVTALLPRDQWNDAASVLPLLDSHRRDLTINCMFYNLRSGRIEDYTQSGYDDLATMTLRTPLEPVKTFTDDPLRVLRVLRFHSRYSNSRIAPEVIEGMKDPEVQLQITRKIVNPSEAQGIVVERTAEELRKLMKGSQPEKSIKLMYDIGLLGKMLNLPSSFSPLDMDQRNRWHELNIIQHTMEVLKNVNRLAKEFGLTDDQRMMMNLSALFHDIGKLDPRSHKDKPDGSRGYSGRPAGPNGEPAGIPHEISSFDQWSAFAKSLKLSDEETSWIGDLVSGHMRPHSHIEDEVDVSDSSLRRYIRKNPNWVFQYIHAMADAMSKNTNPAPNVSDPYRQNLLRLRDLAPSADATGGMPKSQDLLRGDEIMKIVGLPPKPPAGSGLTGYIEVVKEKIRDAQDVNPNLTKDQAINIVSQMMSSGELDQYKPNRN